MALRAVIYSRYSSDKQRFESIEDQQEVCRRLIEGNGWQFVGTYDDPAISGASVLTRPGYQLLMRDAESRVFDIVVVEAIDRLGRRLADVASCHDQLTFRGIQIHAVGIGLVTQMHIALLGSMAQMQMTDLAAKTKRGQL
jgi:site-specific DNA recombinase